MTPAITLSNDNHIVFPQMNLCSQLDELKNEYVHFTGGIAGISDAPLSESDPKALDCRPDEVHFDRD
jgi:hypothetical protein